jgi:hypothetical protein
LARIRQIKPEFFLDDELAGCSISTRYLFIGLWPIADRLGRLEYRPTRIKAMVFPYDDDITVKKVTGMLDQLSENGFIIEYVVADRKYIQIRSFTKHQHCHLKETPSTIPEPTESTVLAPVLSGVHRTSTVLAPVLHRTSRGTSTSTSTNGEMEYGVMEEGAEAPVSGSTLFEIYKIENQKLPTCIKLTDDRRQKSLSRIKDNGFVDDFRKAVIRAQGCAFLLGQNDRGWKATFDWFITNDQNVYKVLEGKYEKEESEDVKRVREFFSDVESELPV